MGAAAGATALAVRGADATIVGAGLRGEDIFQSYFSFLDSAVHLKAHRVSNRCPCSRLRFDLGTRGPDSLGGGKSGPFYFQRVCNIEQLLEATQRQSATNFDIDGTRSWVSDGTSFDLTISFKLWLDSKPWVRLLFLADPPPPRSEE
jgi:hypothetical protein